MTNSLLISYILIFLDNGDILSFPPKYGKDQVPSTAKRKRGRPKKIKLEETSEKYTNNYDFIKKLKHHYKRSDSNNNKVLLKYKKIWKLGRKNKELQKYNNKSHNTRIRSKTEEEKVPLGSQANDISSKPAIGK